jgi:hypothetical protein
MADTHILVDQATHSKGCPLLRKEAWAENTIYHAKLWGTEAELCSTAAFLEKMCFSSVA